MKKLFIEPEVKFDFFSAEVFMSPNIDIGWDDLV